ncbi:DUF2971 domain-containing protein [Buttiauxella sp. S04-F03]|uniref:DUF2971 domain-containing protein n=1 Tax=Buttiauxella sp. S04-F03 TaxID=2904525 RepID=UPI001E5583CB|nr:DUF2971 domain-containing protein [Buttiauxella sp. S04-F03]MCE0814784.1 DUF2971 domain-containing protein [Buttiauxella sp. S04-F03]
MLVKYFGYAFDSVNKIFSLRTSFISDGLFRMTQPKFLNDKSSESRVKAYFNEFSPADYAWAKRAHNKMQLNNSYVPSKEFLEDMFLKPTGSRYGDSYPHLLEQDGFSSMEEFDKKQLDQSAEKINAFLLEAISCQLGVLSLSKSDTNELMWTHYATEGKGLAVTFKNSHPFFKKFPPKEVTYSADKRTSLTYYKGMMRMNGYLLKNFRKYDLSKPSGVTDLLSENNIDSDDITERLLYSKSEKWAPEDETRIVCSLKLCEDNKGALLEQQFGVELPEEQVALFRHYEISLKQIPFDAFESIVFGYCMSESDKSIIIELVRNNKDLSHLKLRQARLNIFEQVEIVDCVVK